MIPRTFQKLNSFLKYTSILLFTDKHQTAIFCNVDTSSLRGRVSKISLVCTRYQNVSCKVCHNLNGQDPSLQSSRPKNVNQNYHQMTSFWLLYKVNALPKKGGTKIHEYLVLSTLYIYSVMHSHVIINVLGPELQLTA